ncbi:hypothetical protein V2H45_24805 [Tumidithrix elongata RA019]|uniref:Uncharacterized protein n=1 Tax=Tumidithrix elongata BACA0141 TaxID=2716417 RepID=A0AAW9QC05_9CYAN|nr:hypothetical protein [Tumidithrix elongata RA019]
MADPILRLPAKTVAALVSELNGLQDRFRSGEQLEIPEITLLLDAGHSLSGVIVQITKSSSSNFPEPDATLLLQHRDNAMNISYIPIVSIRGITVHYNDRNLHLLSSGKIKPFSGKVPSRLELERKARSLSELLAGLAISIAWDEIPCSDQALQSLDLMLADLESVMIGIQSDDMGRTSLQGQVERIEIRVGMKAEVRLLSQSVFEKFRVEKKPPKL